MSSTSINWEKSNWRAALQRSVRGAGLQQLNMRQQRALAAEGANAPWGASNPASPDGQRGDYLSVFSAGAASPRLLCAVLGHTT